MKRLMSILRPHGHLQLYRKGASILLQGEIPRNCFVIIDGIVRGYTITSSGEERLVGLYGPNDLLPVPWIFGHSPMSIFYYDAVNDVRLLKVSKDTLHEVIAANPETNDALVSLLSIDYTAVLMRITGLVQPRAIDKIAYTLYFLAFRFGIEVEPGKFEFTLKLSQTMIAQLIGQTRESTAKNLKTLRAKKVLIYERSSYIVDVKRLEKFLGEDSFRNITIR